MSTPHREDTSRSIDPAPGPAAPEQSGRIPGEAEAAGPAAGDPAPLTSLTSLLGGSVEGGAACAADGTCD